MSIILVTGGAGFIGSHVTDFLIHAGNTVIILDDLSGGFKENINEKAIFIEGSITDEALVKKIFTEFTVDYVFHLAAYAAENLSHFIRRFNYETNLIGSINLINAAIESHVKCFVFTSSIAVYGEIPPFMKEDDVTHPSDPYGIAKLAIEYDLQAAHSLFGLNYIIFRPHNVYGERQNMEDKYRNVVTIFMNQMMQNKPVTIFGDGTQTRSFSYVKDVVKIIAESIHNSSAYNQILNIGSDNVISINELAKIIANKLAVQPSITHLQERKEVKHAYSDHTKLCMLFGRLPMTPFEEGIEKTITWGKTMGARKVKDFTHLEIKNGLPEGWN